MKHPATAFLEEIEAFLNRSGMTPSAFGWECLKDRNFVSDVRAGRMPSLRLVDRVNRFIADHEERAA